ncbi:MAG: hypothetical protein JWO94_2033, partial [Verrucomicrobiaceae bacterium]|nr:hypothetical protein [Verrucomicrobiaceae bacterium]
MTIALPSPVNAEIRDFADWLPPILVKELRQGLRARAFVGGFVAVQTAMIVLLGLRLLDTAAAGQYLPENIDEYQWLVIGFALLILLPLRGLTAISEETRQNTLPLMQLTQMGSMRLVCGKWLALVSQTLLLVVAILPYQVLTYFFGEVDVIENIEILGGLLLESLVLTALCIAFSPANIFVRMVMLGLAFLPVGATVVGFVEHISNGGGSGFLSSSGPAVSWVVMFVFAALAAIVFLLAVAAARISHGAENAAARIRGIALAIMAGSMIGICLGDASQCFVWVILSMPMLMWAAMEAMTEHASGLPSLYVPWVKRGRWGEGLGRIFYPGWGTGVLFVLLMMVLMEVEGGLIGICSGDKNTDPARFFGIFFQLGMVMLYPGVLLCAMPRLRQRHLVYLGMQMSGIAWFVAGSMAGLQRGTGGGALLSFVPPAAFLASMSYSAGDGGWVVA